MRLLLDENLSPQQAATLREQGHDAVAVLDVGLSGQPDENIRAYAIQENRVLLTLDVDFANMLRFPPAGTPGVIPLKIHPPTEETVREQIQKALALLKATPFVGCLAVSLETSSEFEAEDLSSYAQDRRVFPLLTSPDSPSGRGSGVMALRERSRWSLKRLLPKPPV